MEEVDNEETKPFGHEEAVKAEEETQPDPDEVLNMDQGNGRVWSVKIPKHLMEKWSAIDKDGTHLATIRVYDKEDPAKKQRIVLLVPPEPGIDVNNSDFDEYELDMVNESVDNQFVIADREKAPGSRARTSILTGRVKHECNMRPLFTDAYRRRMRERTKLANTPQRQIRLIDEVASTGRINMLSSGVAPGSAGFSTLVKTKQKPPKGSFERFARMPRNQLLDMLFALYREKPRWSAKDLRARTEQPEAYLKEVLLEIADLHRSGEFNGLYELKPSFKDSTKSESGGVSEAAAALLINSASGSTGDANIDEDDEDEEDDDMEEIS